jgi:2,3,4,5-tetrahydropyridine-2,6-dicarboxylate N-succinyltransferase
MSHPELAKIVDDAFERREEVGPATGGRVREAVDEALDLLDRGKVRVAERQPNGDWQVNRFEICRLE